jgi:hypothetical protein
MALEAFLTQIVTVTAIRQCSCPVKIRVVFIFIKPRLSQNVNEAFVVAVVTILRRQPKSTDRVVTVIAYILVGNKVDMPIRPMCPAGIWRSRASLRIEVAVIASGDTV